KINPYFTLFGTDMVHPLHRHIVSHLPPDIEFLLNNPPVNRYIKKTPPAGILSSACPNPRFCKIELHVVFAGGNVKLISELTEAVTERLKQVPIGHTFNRIKNTTLARKKGMNSFICICP